MNGEPLSTDTKERRIFLEALDLPTPAERTAYLERACGSDPALRTSVETLLQNYKNDDFLETPALVLNPIDKKPGRAIWSITELIAQRILSPPSRPESLAFLDHFEILRILGSGGMGIVLLARDLDTGREVAIKLVRPDLVTNAQIVHGFLKEANHLKQLEHPNIVPVLEISNRPQGPYFVMPYFNKGSLSGRIKPGLPLDAETVLDLATQVADGLSFAHRNGIIHRDLKPANILLGANNQLCLADFGLARSVFNDSLMSVEDRRLEGTACYMSPAVAAGDVEDTRCDIYSFGALLYEMLTGHPPYSGHSTKEILDQIIAGPPKSIASFNAGVDQGLVVVAEGAMARELRNRYADMRDVINDLRLIKENQRPQGPHETIKETSARPWQVGRVPKKLWIPACVAFTGAVVLALWPRENSEITHMNTNLSAICIAISGILGLWILVSPLSLKHERSQKWKLAIAIVLVLLCAILGGHSVRIAALLCAVGLAIVVFLKIFLNAQSVKQVFPKQSTVRSTRSVMLQDLTRLRERFIQAKDTVCRQQPSLQINPVKVALDAIDQLKIELEGAPTGDYSLQSEDQAVGGLDKLLQKDSQIQSALKELTEKQIAALDGMSPGAIQPLTNCAQDFVQELAGIQQKLRERQRLAATMKS